jgi:hypothetical protein
VSASPTQARRVYRLVVTAGLLVMLAANLPGHLSVDSVIALHQGHTGVRETWAPAVASWILGRFDALSPGTGLYVTASGALLYLSLVSLAELRPRTSWAAPVVALLVALTPQLLVYQGIVWKDVLFANLMTAGFIWLAHALKGGRGWQALAAWVGAGLCLSLAVLVRQNGALAALFAAAAVIAVLRARPIMIRAGAGLAVLLVLFGTAAAIDAATQPERGESNLRGAGVGMRILQHYDVVAVAARDPAWRLDEIAAVRPAEAALIRQKAAAYYSAERVDTLGGDPAFGRALWRAPGPVMAAQWRSAILEEPVVYLRHRADVMRWLLAPPALGRCLPVFTGVEGPPAMLADLGLQRRLSPADRALSAYAGRFFASPVYSHLAYALLAVVVAGLALRRGETTDVVMACLMGAALAFAATFLVISIACDYRYLYALDLAALVGALYLAIDPPFGRRAQRESSASRAA